MVKKINHNMLFAGNMNGIRGVVIHNDAGSMSPEAYVNWLWNRNKALGIAHYYINRHAIARVIDTFRIAWHTGHPTGNGHYIGYEVCESMSASDKDFLANEDMTLMQATEDLIFYGLPINENTVKLHHEFVPTTCPHRSMALHGGTTASTKSYFIQRMKHFATLGKTVEEMMKGKPAPKVTPKATPKPAPAPKPASNAPVVTRKSGSHKFTSRSAVKNTPDMKAKGVAVYEVGEVVNYDQIVRANGYEWFSYLHKSGIRRYVAHKRI